MRNIASYGVATLMFKMPAADFVAIATGDMEHDLNQIRYHADKELEYYDVDAFEVHRHTFYSGPGRGAAAYCDILDFELGISDSGTITLFERYYARLVNGEPEPYALYIPDDVLETVYAELKEIYEVLDIESED